MKNQNKKSRKPTHYAKISLAERVKLIALVLQKSFSVSKASRQLGIKVSTAKLIFRTFREDGSFFEKRSDRLARLAAIQASQASPQPTPPNEVQTINQQLYANSPMVGYFPQAQYSYNVQDSYMIVGSPYGIWNNYDWVTPQILLLTQPIAHTMIERW